MTRKEQADAIRDVADTIFNEGFRDEADRLAEIAGVIGRPDPQFSELDEWQRLVHEGGERFGWAWLEYQSKVLGVFDSFGVERSDFRLLAVKLALLLGTTVQEKLNAVRGISVRDATPDDVQEIGSAVTQQVLATLED